MRNISKISKYLFCAWILWAYSNDAQKPYENNLQLINSFAYLHDCIEVRNVEIKRLLILNRNHTPYKIQIHCLPSDSDKHNISNTNSMIIRSDYE